MNQACGILVETEPGRAKPAVAGLFSLARQTQRPVCALVVNAGTPPVDEQLTAWGASHIVHVCLPPERQCNPDVVARAAAGLVQDHSLDCLVGLSSHWGREVLPRIAAHLDAPLVMDCMDLDMDRGTAVTSQYSGKTLATVQAEGPVKVFGIRPGAVPPPDEQQDDREKTPRPAPVTAFDAGGVPEHGLQVLRTPAAEQGSGASLVEAEVIVAGGRGMKNRENFALLERCARLLNGAVGASRVAVDEGWVPYTMQVGQTGEKVSPRVYIACGISGSIQHFAGMKTAGMVIAVNTDETAAIMRACDYYACTDVLAVVTELNRLLETRRNGAAQ